MVQKVIKKLLKKRHFWRHVGFDELSELYASEFLRSLAMSVVGIFVPIYLYKIGYSLSTIFAMQIVWAASRPFFSYVAAKSIAFLGPKHTVALGTVCQIVYLCVLVSVQTFDWPLALLGILGSLSYALFGIAIQVDFSKIKHTEHGGKELSFVTICERIGSALGPLVGGLIASFYHPQATIILAIFILAGSLVPIFMSAEPTKVRQIITLKGFPWRRHKRDFISATFFGVENVVSVVVWPIFIAIAVFKSNTFAAVGLVVSISTGVALLTFYLIGKLIDDHRGGLLLKAGAISNAFVHLIRPFATTPAQVLTISAVNEPMTASYRMPFNKGLYDNADSVPGYRIVYLTVFDTIRMMGVLTFWTIAYLLSITISDEILMLQLLFLIGGLASLGILTQRFPALKS